MNSRQRQRPKCPLALSSFFLFLAWLGLGGKIVDGFQLSSQTRYVVYGQGKLNLRSPSRYPFESDRCLRNRSTAIGSARVDTIPEPNVADEPLPRPSPTAVDPLADEVVPSTMTNAIRVFLFGSYNGPRAVCFLLTLVTSWRGMLLDPVSLTDGAVFVGMIVAWCFQEHWLHGRVLHSDIDWYGKEIHQAHHARPYHHISLDPAWLMVAWLVTAHCLFRCALPLPLALSATLGYALAGLWYEFLHFIVHTRVRFRRGSYLQTMKDHHARHHLVDHRYWLGFSLPSIDSFFGTNPSVQEVRRGRQ
jgi:4-hydroxysphinganine ceramide fatty acyl 2-hydroxylase